MIKNINIIAFANNNLRKKLTVRVNKFISLQEVLDLDFAVMTMETKHSDKEFEFMPGEIA